MIASVQCNVCGGWHSVTVRVTSDEVGPDGIRRVEWAGRMEPCPNTRVTMTLTKEER